jgi:hypothetical protein
MDENEQKQQLSIAYLHAVASAAGYACYVPCVDDDSVDRTIAARGPVRGVLESPRIDVQLKSTVREALAEGENSFAFRLKRKNFDELRGRHMVPRLLVVLLLPSDPGQWIEQGHEQMISRYAAYFLSLSGMPAKANVSTVSVALPRPNLFSVEHLRRLMRQASRGRRKLT